MMLEYMGWAVRGLDGVIGILDKQVEECHTITEHWVREIEKSAAKLIDIAEAARKKVE